MAESVLLLLLPFFSPSPSLTRTQWLICAVAAIGFAFDIYEILVLPLIVRPALMELGPLAPGTPEFNAWVGWLLWIPRSPVGSSVFSAATSPTASAAGRFSSWSILLYAFSAVGAGYSTSLPMLLFFRTTTFVGVCVEFVAAVAWLAELFPDPKRREAVLGYTQAFSSVGGLMVTFAYTFAVDLGPMLPLVRGGHEPWRYTLMSGIIPAIPLIVIRPFLPESPTWRRKKESGTLKRPSLAEIFQPRAAKDDDRDGAHVRLQLRGRVRRHSASSAHRSRASRSSESSEAPDRDGGGRGTAQIRRSGASSDASRSRSSRCASFPGGRSSGCSRFPV